MPFDLSQVNWVTVGIFLIVLVVGWTIVKTVLRLTMRVFSLGCIGLIILGAIVVAFASFSR